MNTTIRPYGTADYEQVRELYKQSDLYGGHFDEDRDSRERLQKRVEGDADAILVAEQNGKIVGTLSLIEDGRTAWLFRFCVINENETTTRLLFEKAVEVLKEKGHKQVLVYAPVGSGKFESRYDELGFTKGADYTCFWRDI